jgi:uncharacterized protein (TIGR03086 family)
MSRVHALTTALEQQLAVVRVVRPEQLDLESRCEGWTIRQVLDHSLGVTHKFANFAAGLTDEPHTPQRAMLSSDHETAAAEEVNYASNAWRAADMTRRCRLPFGTFQASEAAGINLFDALAHTWDIAAPIGVDLAQDHPVWLEGLDAATAVMERSRDREHYAAAIPSGDSASPMRRFLAYLGRAHVDRP